MNKITFKKESRPTGLFAVGHPYPTTNIKMDKKEIGSITPPTWRSKDSHWEISIFVFKEVSDSNPNCNWKRITFSQKFNSEEDGRKWFLENFEIINKKYKIRQTDSL